MVINMISTYSIYRNSLNSITNEKKLITTINAYSYTLTFKDSQFAAALHSSDVLIPDGVSIVWAMRWLTGAKIKKIAGVVAGDADILVLPDLDAANPLYKALAFFGADMEGALGGFELQAFEGGDHGITRGVAIGLLEGFG